MDVSQVQKASSLIARILAAERYLILHEIETVRANEFLSRPNKAKRWGTDVNYQISNNNIKIMVGK